MYLSDIFPPYNLDAKVTFPNGAIASKHFAVFLDYMLQLEQSQISVFAKKKKKKKIQYNL